MRWMELIKDYDCIIEYHPKKGNMEVDALSHKPTANLASIRIVQLSLMLELKGLNAWLTVDDSRALLVNFDTRPLFTRRNIGSTNARSMAARS